MSQAIKIFKKGETLFKEGDKLSHVFLVQSGSVSVCLLRPKKNIELFPLGPNQIIGEHAILGATTHIFSAVATTEVKVIEIAVDAMKQSSESLPQLMKLIFKSLIEKSKNGVNEIKSSRLEKDSSACPEDQVAKIYGAIYYTAKAKGVPDEKTPQRVTVEWSLMKQYTHRIFGESSKRIEQAVSLLTKLKMAEFVMGKPPEDPEGPDQIVKAIFPDLAPIEAFFEFYQYYFFKSAKSEVLKVDDFARSLVETLLDFTKAHPVDRFGVVSVELNKFMDQCKSQLNITLNSNHFERLEQKGIFLKRKAMSDGNVVIQFDQKEIRNQLFSWKILREIEKWNEKGFVDLSEEDPKKLAKKDGPSCTACGCGIVAQAKFCSECGAKVAA